MTTPSTPEALWERLDRDMRTRGVLAAWDEVTAFVLKHALAQLCSEVRAEAAAQERAACAELACKRCFNGEKLDAPHNEDQDFVHPDDRAIPPYWPCRASAIHYRSRSKPPVETPKEK